MPHDDDTWRARLIVGDLKTEVGVIEVQSGREHLFAPADGFASAFFSADSQNLISLRRTEPLVAWHLSSLDLVSLETVQLCDLEPSSPKKLIRPTPAEGRYLVVWSVNEHRSAWIDSWFSRLPFLGSTPAATWTVQLLDCVDWKVLNERLKQNSLAEKLTAKWLKQRIAQL